MRIVTLETWKKIHLVLQRKPFAFELFFSWANAGFFTFSSKTRSMVPTSNALVIWKEQTKNINMHNKSTLTYFKISLAAA